MYGMGAKLMAKNLGVSIEEGKDILNKFFETFPDMKKFIEYNEWAAKQVGYVEDYLGRRRHLKDAQLDELEFRATKDLYTNCEIFPDCNPADNRITIPDEDANKKWKYIWETEYKGKGYNVKAEFKEKAKEAGVSTFDNGAFISKTLTQSTNARIQGCLSGDVRVQTKDFGIKKLKELSGQTVTLWDGYDWTSGLVVASGKKQKCVIHFTDGSSIVCSPNHKFCLYDETSKVFIECKDLQVLDNVSISNNYYDFIGKSMGNYVTIASIDITDEYIDMYDVCDTDRGYFVADGLITHNSAASLTKKAMVNIYRDKKLRDLGFHILIPIHDELLGECPKENAEEVSKRLQEVMIDAAKPECSVVMKCDPYIVKRWYADELSNIIEDDYYKLTHKQGKSEEEAVDILCKENCELHRDVVKQMCLGTYDVLSGDI